jgi:DNA-binding response OmpR family regulator
MNEVLYVAHSTTSQKLVVRYLEGVASVALAPSLAAAGDLLRDRRFSLLIAGYNFPEGDCLQLIQYVRSSPVHSRMPVIVLSSSMDSPTLTRVLRAGANDGLAKPVHVPEFRAMVTRMLSAPYVRSLDHPVIDVTCFRWRSPGRFSEYCPELGLLITGPTAEDTLERMRTALQQRGGMAGVRLGETSEEAVVRHLVTTAGSLPAEPTCGAR